MSWHDKAYEIIARHCAESYRIANTCANGTPRKRHVPYSVPPIAAALVDALNRNDEREAKRLFLVERTGAWSLI